MRLKMPMTIKTYLCKSCANLGATQDGSPACILHKKFIDPNEDFCSDHINITNNITCEWCGQMVTPKEINIWTFNDVNKFLCPHCSQMVNTCQTCAYGNDCGFANDYSMPQMVNQTIRQGFMTMQTQVKNPKLIEKHCLSCRCSCDNKGTCLRDEHGANCGHWMAGL